MSPCEIDLVKFNFCSSETGCPSHHGNKYVKCPNSDRCFLESTFDATIDCKETDGPTSDCKTTSGQDGWQCNDGKCIEKQNVCDNNVDCVDSSDEDKGCRLYPRSTCNSWFGLEHVECQVEGMLHYIVNVLDSYII